MNVHNELSLLKDTEKKSDQNGEVFAPTVPLFKEDLWLLLEMHDDGNYDSSRTGFGCLRTHLSNFELCLCSLSSRISADFKNLN